MRITYFNSPCKSCLYTLTTCTIFLFLSTAIFSSCFIAKPSYIFKEIIKDTVIHIATNDGTQLKIQKNDLLNITISSLNTLEDATFNSTTVSLSSGSKDGGGALGHLVNEEGNIYLHKLGTIMVAGSTRKELKIKLENDLSPFLKDPIVTVNFGNHFITVLGETGSTQMVNMPAEKMSLIDAIVVSGNAGLNANFKNLLVIRETSNAKEFKQINLENKSIFTSSWYYLLPKDILVIKPDEDKIMGEQKKSRNMLVYSTILSGISFCLFILDRILRR